MRNNDFEKGRLNFLSEAEMLLEQNKLQEAFNLAEERLRSLPGDADAYVIAGHALIAMDRPDEARDILWEVGENISELSLVYERMGDIYRKKGFHKDAAVCYERFISLHPSAEKARKVIGKIALLEQEDQPVTEVGFVYDENIPEPELFTVTLAELYIQQGHLQIAARILEEILTKDPQNILAAEKLEKIKALSVSQSSSATYSVKNDALIKTLSTWLKNIERLRINAAER